MIKIVAVGKIKDKHMAALIDDYTKKIKNYHKFEIVEVKDEEIVANDSTTSILDKEGERILKLLSEDEYVILLDLHGAMMDSIAFSEKLDSLFIHYSKITFVIGGSLGLSDKLRQRTNMALKLSPMTFLHQMTRLILCEQIFRAFKILHHETYHK